MNHFIFRNKRWVLYGACETMLASVVVYAFVASTVALLS